MALTAFVEQDGELIKLGTVEEEARLFYDVSGNQTFLQTDGSDGVLVDRLTISNAGLGTWAGAWTVTGIITSNGNITVSDDVLLGIGTGNTARFSYDTTDANANALLLQLPAGGATDVPVLAVGQSIESVDLGLFNGVVDPILALFGIGAVTTGTALRVYKARGTIASPTVVTSGDDLFSIDVYGAVAAGSYVQAARILFEMTGTIGSTQGPGVITFQTATDAAPSVLTTALTISAAQVITVANGITFTDGDIDLSAAGTGSYDLILKDAVADALSIRRATTDMIVFNSTTPSITVTPATTVTGLITANGGITLGGLLSGGTGNDITAINNYIQALDADMSFYLRNALTNAYVRFYTRNASAADTLRLRITNYVATAIAEWTNIYHTGLKYGLAGTATGAFTMDGATSGVVTITVAAEAGTWTMELPAAVPGTNGDQLSATTAGVCSWTAASSLREYKDVLTDLPCPQDALDKILGTQVYKFHYAEKAKRSTGDFETEYVGVMGEEAPWAMHHGGMTLNPINTFGYTVLAIQALETQIEKLQQEVEELRGRGTRV